MGAKKILVVDFDQEFLRFLSQFLRDEGFTVVTAPDGLAGLESHKGEAPDLVITEAMLPKLHGFELCSRISHSASRKTPVIIVTGVYRDTVYKTEALHTFGASAYFEKPLDAGDLLASVRKVLGIPERKPKAEESIDAAIMEALVAGAPPPAAVKPAAKAPVEDDIDDMLRSTLAEFGLQPGKKKTVAPAAKPAESPKPAAKAVRLPDVPKPPEPQSTPWPAAATAPGAHSPVIGTPRAPKAAQPPKAEAQEKGPRAQVRPPERPVEKPVPAPVMPPVSEAGLIAVPSPTPFEPVPAFGAYAEGGKRGFQPRLFGALAGVLVLSSATFLVLKPKGRPTPVREEAALSAPAADAASDIGSGIRTAGGSRSTAGASGNTSVSAAAPPKAKPKPQAPADKPAPKLEEVVPLSPEPASNMAIQVPEEPEPWPEAADPAPGGRSGEAIPDEPVQAPAPKLLPGDLVPLGEVDVPPEAIRTQDPVYPVAAMNLRQEGSVMVNALISETGDVIQTAVIGGSRGSLGFDRAAENAVRKWKFNPARKSGVPVRVWKPVTIGFKLKK